MGKKPHPPLPSLTLPFPLQVWWGVVNTNLGQFALLLLGVTGVVGGPGEAPGTTVGVPTLAGVPTDLGTILTQEPRSGQVLQSLVILRVQGLVEVQAKMPRQGCVNTALAIQLPGLWSALSAKVTGSRVTSTGEVIKFLIFQFFFNFWLTQPLP